VIEIKVFHKMFSLSKILINITKKTDMILILEDLKHRRQYKTKLPPHRIRILLFLNKDKINFKVVLTGNKHQL